MSGPALILALPSKGRLQEDAAAWLADCGYPVSRAGGDRGYAARLKGLDAVEVRLLSAREIALGLDAGAIHLGVTGEDLLREESPDADARLHFLRGLGFGRADLIVAVPQSWIDVHDMADLDEVAARERARLGRQMRVATKYARLTRGFFAKRGLADYRIVESHGATEGAPAAGLADVIVDITTTGATLAANHLKILPDGLILKSQAQLAASRAARWDAAALDALRALLDAIEARAAGADMMQLRSDRAPEVMAQAARRFGGRADADGCGLLCPKGRALAACAYVRDAVGATVSAAPVAYVFEPTNPAFEAFCAQIHGAATSIDS